MSTTALSAAKQKILDWLEAGTFLKARVRVGGQEVEFRTPKEAMSALREIEQLLEEEAGTFDARVYAVNAGRGTSQATDSETYLY
jgi:hypothetical protein